ncbi:MAG: hypothetical protein AB1400_08870 [Pseudomonadota bacterium]
MGDTDILCKLARCNLLDHLLKYFGVPPNKIWILPALTYMTEKKLLVSDAPALTVLKQFASSVDVAVIPNADPINLERFSKLDPGEQQMFALLCEQENISSLVTGDKRALKEVAKIARTDDALMTRLTGSVVCLESLMLGFIERFGFEEINRDIPSGVDTVLSAVFGLSRNEEHARAALNSYLAALQRDASFVQ